MPADAGISPHPEISVVLSTLGNYEVLKRVLDAYSHQDVPAGTFEMIVVVDRVDPQPARVDEAIATRPFPVQRITGRAPGLSANRNTGWRAARANLVLFADNDTIPVRRHVGEHLAWHRRHPGVETAIVGHVRWARELRVTPFMRWLERGVQFDFPAIPGIEAGWAHLYGANSSIKRRFIERVGDWDEQRMPYLYDDLDWSYRATRHGLRVLYNRRAVVDHLRFDATLEFWERKVRPLALAERQFVELHPEVPPWFLRMFTKAMEYPPPRQHPRVDRYVPGWLPWLGPRVKAGLDLAFKQALAPHFLAAWEEAAATIHAPAQPVMSDRENSSLGSPPDGPK